MEPSRELFVSLSAPGPFAVAYRSGFAVIAIGASVPIPEGYELLSVASGVLGVDTRTHVVASLLGRGGKYFLEVALVLALGVVVALVAVAYLVRRRWLPSSWRTIAD